MEFGIGNSREIATLTDLEECQRELRKLENLVDITRLEAAVVCYGANATYEDVLGLAGDSTVTDVLSVLENECGWDIDQPLETAVNEYYSNWDELDDQVYNLSNALPEGW